MTSWSKSVRKSTVQTKMKIRNRGKMKVVRSMGWAK